MRKISYRYFRVCREVSAYRILPGCLSLFCLAAGMIHAAEDAWSALDDWKQTDPIESRMKRHTKAIFSLVIHHTETPNEGPLRERARLQNVQSYHINDRHWGDIAYHYLIGPSGKIYAGRAEKFQGDSGTKYDLDGRLLICVLGSFDHQLPTAPALNSLIRLVKSKAKTLGLDVVRDVSTHREVAATDCPGEALYRWIKDGGLTGHGPGSPETGKSVGMEKAVGQIRHFHPGREMIQLAVPPGFQETVLAPEIATKSTLLNFRIRSEDGNAEFAVKICDPETPTIDWPTGSEGEVVTTEEENRLAVTGPGKTYTRYFHRTMWKTHPVLWEFKAKDSKTRKRYREAYKSFKKSLRSR